TALGSRPVEPALSPPGQPWRLRLVRKVLGTHTYRREDAAPRDPAPPPTEGRGAKGLVGTPAHPAEDLARPAEQQLRPRTAGVTGPPARGPDARAGGGAHPGAGQGGSGGGTAAGEGVAGRPAGLVGVGSRHPEGLPAGPRRR